MTEKIEINLNWTILLTIVFVVLKLTNVIDWSWWWVLAPIWIPFLIALLLILIGFIFFKDVSVEYKNLIEETLKGKVK